MSAFTKWIRQLNPGYCAAFLLLTLCYVLTIIISTKITTQTNAVSGSDTTKTQLDQLLSNLKGAQAAWGQYVLTNNYKNLIEYYATHRSVDSIFNKIYLFSSITPQQRQNLDTLYTLINNILPINSGNGHNHITIYNKNNIRMLDSLQAVNVKYATLMDSITSLVNSMQTDVKQKAEERREALLSLAALIKVISYITLLIALFLAIYMLVIYDRERRAKRKASRKAEEYHKELELRIEELTEKNKEITRLKSMEKFSSLGRIAAMIAHEIKNPLTNINLATMQLSEELSLDTNIFLSIIKRNSEKINTQINNFLNVTAFTELHIRNISINELLDEALKEAEDRIALEEVKVVKDYSNDICNVAIDTEKMKIAFLNIIFNAIDSMETEKGILSIKTEGKNNKCVITISDNGSGMKKETLSQIFEPFYTTKPKKGSGLGLSQTQNIILNHNGNIDVESQPGQGTSFIITLNFVEDQAVVSALHKE